MPPLPPYCGELPIEARLHLDLLSLGNAVVAGVGEPTDVEGEHSLLSGDPGPGGGSFARELCPDPDGERGGDGGLVNDLDGRGDVKEEEVRQFGLAELALLPGDVAKPDPGCRPEDLILDPRLLFPNLSFH